MRSPVVAALWLPLLIDGIGRVSAGATTRNITSHLRTVISSGVPPHQEEENAAQEVVVSKEDSEFWSRYLQESNSMSDCVEIGQSCDEQTTCCGGSCRLQAPFECDSPECRMMVCAAPECIDPADCGRKCPSSVNVDGAECCPNPFDDTLQDFCVKDTDCCGDGSFCLITGGDDSGSGVCCAAGGFGCNFEGEFYPSPSAPTQSPAVAPGFLPCTNDPNTRVIYRRDVRSPREFLTCRNRRIRNNRLCKSTDLRTLRPIEAVCQNECEYRGICPM